jgi:hypothetical protein
MTAHGNLRSQSTDSHNQKLRRMTRDYGSADKGANILAPTNKLKGEGPEMEIGYGSNPSPMPRADRRSRGGCVVGRKNGGKVRRKADGGPTGSTPAVSPVEAADMDESISNKAAGGRTRKGKGGHTHVNVIIGAPPGGAAGAIAPPVRPVPPVVPVAAPPAMPPRPPMGAMPGALPGAGGPMPMPPPGGMPPGGLPPGIMPPRKRGGVVMAKAGGGGVEDPAEHSYHEQGLKPFEKGSGGGKHHGTYTAGAGSGEGREQKMRQYGRRVSHAKPQVV